MILFDNAGCDCFSDVFPSEDKYFQGGDVNLVTQGEYGGARVEIWIKQESLDYVRMRDCNQICEDSVKMTLPINIQLKFKLVNSSPITGVSASIVNYKS